ncbi:MAG TPA: hypothetical protein P5294_10480 [Smithellaceae bacterium]|nr:hypothetical protein [Smithellaceae bacterium]HRS90150.1 hypothetical protein [Smithellaceae bacterium]HRV26955.1 hypothetical protein [Smithellaceae bacterium]
MGSAKITVGQVEKYIEQKLNKKLQNDLKKLRMIKEADLECCAYFHLRKYLYRDSSWKIFARKHSLHTEHYIDLLLFRKNTPRIALELKWNKQTIGNKDKESLSKSIKKLRVNRAYFISTITGKKSCQDKLSNKKIDAYTIKGIFIPIGELIQGWHSRRKKFMSEMSKGKAKHKRST